MAKSLRDANVELWRCFCMFAVVLGHVVYNNNIGSMDGFRWHVPGFLLISGYFGIRFSWRKVLALIGIVYGCYWLTIPYRWGSDSLFSLLVPHGGWFLPFYLCLMVISQVLNAALKDRAIHYYIALTTVILLLAGWVPTLLSGNHVGMLRIPGLQGDGLLLMIATYLSGALLREHNIERRGPTIAWLAGFVLGILTMTLHGRLAVSNGFASPCAIFTAICGFMLIKRLPRIEWRAATIINFIAPSMFGVYILHETCIRKAQLFDGGGQIRAIIHASILFLLCLGIDLLRRFIVKGLVLAIHSVMSKQRGTL